MRAVRMRCTTMVWVTMPSVNQPAKDQGSGRLQEACNGLKAGLLPCLLQPPMAASLLS